MKHIAYLICILSIFVMACGVTTLSTATAQPTTSHKSPPTASPRPTAPQETKTVVVCSWVDVLRVRECAGTSCKEIATLAPNQFVLSDGVPYIAPDMGTWIKLDGGGFINTDYICKVK